MRCIKTGATVIIAGRFAHGDLFAMDGGLEHILRCNRWSYEPTPFVSWPIHAEFSTWREWWEEGAYQGAKIDTVVLPNYVWFDYIGKPYQEVLAQHFGA